MTAAAAAGGIGRRPLMGSAGSDEVRRRAGAAFTAEAAVDPVSARN